jgi:putative hydrolase of the HAD superfamily
MTPRQVDAVIFDYGGVLTNAVAGSIKAWHEADRIDPASFTRTLRGWLGRDAPVGTPVHRLETGELSIAEFEALLAAELTTVDGRPIEAEGILGRLFAGMRPDDAMFDLVTELRRAGLKVGLLSNSWGNTYPRERIDALFDHIVISGEVGLRKPDPAIFELSLTGLGVDAARAVFIDDAEPNTLGAAAVGMHTIVHTSADETRTRLVTLIPDLAVSTRRDDVPNEGARP